MKRALSIALRGYTLCLLLIAVTHSCSAAVVAIGEDQNSSSVGSAVFPSSLVVDADTQSASRRRSDVERVRRSLRGRRHSLSVTQDLASLAEMIHGDSNRRRLNNMMSFLDEVGKRSLASPDYNDFDDNVEENRLNKVQALASAFRRLTRQ